MPRSRSRSRDKIRKRSRSRDKDRKRRDRDRRDRDRDRRRSHSRSDERRDRDRDRRRRDKSKSYDRKDQRHRRHRSKSNERKDRHRDKYSSESSDKKHSQNGSNNAGTSSGSVKPIVIIANTHSKGSKHRSQTENAVAKKNRDHREIFEISNEFSREGFEQFSRDHGIDFTNIETDEDREAVHEKMQELLKAHFATQGIIYPPPPKEDKQPAINAATGFANDGSFLEQFKKMQEEQKLQEELERKRKAENLANLPISRRRGGKILKTGVVAKTKPSNQEKSSSDVPSNAWGMYIKEVQKYKGSSCDSDSKNRPLVK